MELATQSFTVPLTATLQAAAWQMGYSTLRQHQIKAVSLFMLERDVFVSLLTGSGKSLCYGILPVMFDTIKQFSSSIVIVVSPLIALMKDQVRAMVERNVSAVCIGDAEVSVDEVYEGKYQLVYISPEALLTNETWRDMLLSSVYQERLVAFVVDEAHCVKKWGDKFRKEFSSLGKVRSIIPERVHIMAFTATATKQSRQKISKILGIPNIKYCVIQKSSNLEETFAPLVEEVKYHRLNTDRTIIFCRTHDDCSMIYLFIKKRLKQQFTHPIGAPDQSRHRLVEMFTSCTHPDVKSEIIKCFNDASAKLRVVIATITFGMGMDCPNIRRVIHWGSSTDVEMYLQETGRAGGDGKQSIAILYNISGQYHVDDLMKQYIKNKTECRREILLQHFDQSCTNM